MIKKPEKRNKHSWGTKEYIDGYNKGLEVSEAYRKQELDKRIAEIKDLQRKLALNNKPYKDKVNKRNIQIRQLKQELEMLGDVDEICKCVKDTLQNIPIKGDWEGTRACYLNEGAVIKLAKAISERIKQ